MPEFIAGSAVLPFHNAQGRTQIVEEEGAASIQGLGNGENPLAGSSLFLAGD
ncbi:MAG: hypothetical protein NTV93_17070 [Verrucomicrobia bacterium]|nr:hypothetical protein [Verrucomicrobiota bacterium]